MPRLPGPEALGNLPSLRSGAHVPQVSGANPLAEAAGRIGQGLVSLSVEQQGREDALQAAEADARLTTGLTDLRRRFDTDPDWQTFQPRFDDEATRIREEAAGMISNPRVRERWMPRSSVAVSNTFDHVRGRQDRLRGEHEFDRLDTTLGQLGTSYVTAPDDASRETIRRNIEDTIELGRRTGVVPADRLRDLTRRHLYGTIEADMLSRRDSYAAYIELREGDQRVRMPSTGEISELGLSRLEEAARQAGATPAQARKSEARLRADAGALSKMIRDNLAEGVEITQAQHDALVSFGVVRGKDALQELLPLVNTSDAPSIAQAMRGPADAATAYGQQLGAELGLADVAKTPGPTEPVEVRPVPGDRRPMGAAPRSGAVEGIVLHHTSGTTLDSALSQNQLARTGYNYYIDRDGTPYQFAPDDQRMNHIMPPGNSARIPGAWPQLSSDNTIAISVVAQNDADITDAQRNTLRSLTQQLSDRHGIDRNNIIGHGDIQHTRERTEGSTSREFREGRTRVAQRGGTMTDASPPGADPRVEEYADLVQGRAPSSRVSRLPIDRQRVLLGKLEQALRPALMADMDDDLDLIRQTGQAKRLPDGTTSFTRAARVLTGNQFQRYQLKHEEARFQYEALHGLQDMTPDERRMRREQINRAQGERVSIRSRVLNMFDTAVDKMGQEGEKDGAQSVEGGIILPRIATQRRETFGPDGQPILSSETDIDHRLAPAREVAEAHALVRRRDDGRLLSIGTDENGNLVINRVDNGPEASKAQQDAWRIIIDARMDAQARRGIPDRFRAPITKAEAEDLLNMPRRVTDQSEFENLMKAAVDRAYSRYGPYARQALDAAIRFRSNMSDPQTQIASELLGKMISGVGVQPEEMDRLNRSLQLSREERAWLGDFPMEGVGSLRVPGGPAGRRAPEPQPGFLQRMTGGGQAPSNFGTRYTAPQTPIPTPRAAGPGISMAWPKPPPNEVQYLMQHPQIWQEFAKDYGLETTRQILQGLPQP